MKVAMLSPIAWRTPPRHYGPWEWVVFLLTEGLVRRGVDVTLFATKDSITSAKLEALCPRPYEEDPNLDPKVWEGLHIAHLFEKAEQFDLIHNHDDFLPLNWSGLVGTPVLTTIHGFSSPKILPAYRRYNGKVYYVSISEADREEGLEYLATIHHGIPVEQYRFNPEPGGYLLFFGRIHPEKGTHEAIELARRAGMRLIIAGIIQDRSYFEREVRPHLDSMIQYIGPVGGERKSEILGGAYALLHLIRFREPFGLSLIEAMACGTPVIARGLGAIPEIVQPGRNGWIVDGPEEAVEALEKVRKIDRSECRRSVEERFTQDRMVEDYLRVYRQILDRHKREEKRPWGGYQVLRSEASFKVKKIWVDPHQRLSYQRHLHRKEHWVVIEGKALVLLEGKEISLGPGDSIDIPQGAAHRIGNIGEGPLVFIEIQRGDLLAEEDVIRLEDDYGRSDSKGGGEPWRMASPSESITGRSSRP
ncbi:MAG: glycosyltransferase [Desulfobacterota bacterium]|nr:glycosyltransferase [Thermodesulfobacteriota bacterium]